MSLVLEISEFERKVVQELHHQDGYQKGTAVALGCSVSSLVRYISNIFKRTGFDPRKVEDRVELLGLIPTGIGYNLTAKEKTVILACCDYSMNLLQVSRVLGYHKNSIWYLRNSIQKKTGLDVRNFYDLIKLQKMVQNDSY